VDGHNHQARMHLAARLQTRAQEIEVKRETMRTRIAATLIALAISMSHIASVQALTNGWNFIHANNCGGGPAFGVDFVFVYPTTGGTLFTTDAVTVSLIAPLCASGQGFFVYLNGTDWVATSVYPSVR
jgi:hypothetical protein